MSVHTNMNEDWVTGWVAQRLSEHGGVKRVTATTGRFITVERKNLPDVVVGCVSVDRFDVGTVEEVTDEGPSLQFIVNVKRDALFTRASLDVADELGIAVGEMGDLMRALNHEWDLAAYVNPDTRYIEWGFEQHGSVQHVERLARGCYRLSTRRGDQIAVSVGRQYEMTAEAVRQAIHIHGPVDAVVTANPNAQPISQTAVAAGSAAGVEVLLWKELYSRLNRPWT